MWTMPLIINSFPGPNRHHSHPQIISNNFPSSYIILVFPITSLWVIYTHTPTYVTNEQIIGYKSFQWKHARVRRAFNSIQYFILNG